MPLPVDPNVPMISRRSSTAPLSRQVSGVSIPSVRGTPSRQVSGGSVAAPMMGRQPSVQGSVPPVSRTFVTPNPPSVREIGSAYGTTSTSQYIITRYCKYCVGMGNTTIVTFYQPGKTKFIVRQRVHLGASPGLLSILGEMTREYCCPGFCSRGSIKTDDKSLVDGVCGNVPVPAP